MPLALRRLQDPSSATLLDKSPVTISVSRSFKADAGQLFNAWLDERHAGEWLFATPEGRMQHVEINAMEGSSFSIVERRQGVDAIHDGKFLELHYPNRIVFLYHVKLGLDDRFPATRVTIDIAQQEKGCELTLVHDGVWEEYASRTREGWNMILSNLEAFLTKE